jgi:hypothetical protein
MCAAIFGGLKEDLLVDLTVVYDSLVSAYRNRRDCAQAWIDFGKKAQAMVSLQIPELSTRFAELETLFEEYAKIHEELADKEERSSEDFRDCIERFQVVFRVREEYDMRKEQYMESTMKLEAAHKRIEAESVKPGYEKRQAKLEVTLQEAKQDKVDWLRRYKRKTIQIINVKNEYNKFKVRRIRHGWLLYSDAMKEAAQQEMDVLIRIRRLLESLDIAVGPVKEVLEQRPALCDSQPVLSEGVAKALVGLTQGKSEGETVIPVTPVIPKPDLVVVKEEPVKQKGEALFDVMGEARVADVPKDGSKEKTERLFSGLMDGLSNPFE